MVPNFQGTFVLKKEEIEVNDLSFLSTATNVAYRRCVYESPMAGFLFLFGSTTVENDQITAPTNWGEKDADGDGKE